MRVDRRGGLKDSPRTLTRLNFQLPAKEEVFSFFLFSLSLEKSNVLTPRYRVERRFWSDEKARLMGFGKSLSGVKITFHAFLFRLCNR